MIVYYSMDGNTKMIAEMIQAETGADIIRLDTAVPYEGTDQEIVAQGKAEVNEGYTPKLKPLGVSLDAYDTIILGTPTWWYTMAPAVLSFLRENDLSGKRVIPFQTHAGWPGHGLRDMEDELPGAIVERGKKIQFGAQEFGKLVTPEKEIRRWIAEL